MDTTLNISGMTCQHCVLSVEEELEAIDGVDQVSVALEPGGISTAHISANRDIPDATLNEAVTEAGYTVVTPRA